jgi:hypothetical protein
LHRAAHVFRILGWGLLGVALAGLGGVPATAHATSLEPPAIEDLVWGPEVIPREGTIVVFTGAWEWHSSYEIPPLFPQFTVTDADGSAVPGGSAQLSGTLATGDALVWSASAPLAAGQRYEVTLETVVGDASRSLVAAAEPAPGPTAPAITSALLSETPQTSDCLWCREHEGDDPVCVPTQYEFVPGLLARWQESDGALDRRYVRYRWLALQPDGTYAHVSDWNEGTSGEDQPASRESAFTVASAMQDGELCLAVEAWSLIDGTSARSAPICVAWSELTRVPHEQPQAPACPEGWSELGSDAADDDDPQGCTIASAPGGAAGLGLVLLTLAGRRRRPRTRTRWTNISSGFATSSANHERAEAGRWGRTADGRTRVLPRGAMLDHDDS